VLADKLNAQMGGGITYAYEVLQRSGELMRVPPGFLHMVDNLQVGEGGGAHCLALQYCFFVPCWCGRIMTEKIKILSAGASLSVVPPSHALPHSRASRWRGT
jgi:hypothetical protein